MNIIYFFFPFFKKILLKQFYIPIPVLFPFPPLPQPPPTHLRESEASHEESSKSVTSHEAGQRDILFLIFKIILEFYIIYFGHIYPTSSIYSSSIFSQNSAFQIPFHLFKIYIIY